MSERWPSVSEVMGIVDSVVHDRGKIFESAVSPDEAQFLRIATPEYDPRTYLDRGFNGACFFLPGGGALVKHALPSAPTYDFLHEIAMHDIFVRAVDQAMEAYAKSWHFQNANRHEKDFLARCMGSLRTPVRYDAGETYILEYLRWFEPVQFYLDLANLKRIDPAMDSDTILEDNRYDASVLSHALAVLRQNHEHGTIAEMIRNDEWIKHPILPYGQLEYMADVFRLIASKWLVHGDLHRWNVLVSRLPNDTTGLHDIALIDFATVRRMSTRPYHVDVWSGLPKVDFANVDECLDLYPRQPIDVPQFLHTVWPLVYGTDAHLKAVRGKVGRTMEGTGQ